MHLMSLTPFYIQGIKPAGWASSPESWVFLCVQQRSYLDNRTNQNDDLRHHAKPELWLLSEHKHKPLTSPYSCTHPRGVRYPWVNIHLQPYTLPDPVLDPDCDPWSAAWFSTVLHGGCRPRQPQAFETHADPKALTQILPGRPQHDGRRGQHEICPGPFELGGGDAGQCFAGIRFIDHALLK